MICECCWHAVGGNASAYYAEMREHERRRCLCVQPSLDGLRARAGGYWDNDLGRDRRYSAEEWAEAEHCLRAMKKKSRFSILYEIDAERQRQDAKWGVQEHAPNDWIMILLEEVGEVARAALAMRFQGHDPGKYRSELIQVAAVAVAMVECLDYGTKLGR